MTILVHPKDNNEYIYNSWVSKVSEKEKDFNCIFEYKKEKKIIEFS